MNNNLYQILGVEEDAAMEEIKEAYYQLVREYPPEKNPEKFKKIRNAYETLSDPQAREDYDSQQQYGAEIENLFNKVSKLMDQEKWSQAAKSLKRILVLNSNIDSARNLLGICYLNNQQYTKAVDVFEKLTNQTADVPLYWINLGHAYLDLSINNEAKNYYFEARQAFKAAIEIESVNAAPYMQIAVTYREEGKFKKARDWAEKAINADGKVDFDDFEALFFKCIIYVFDDQEIRFKEEVDRILSLVTDNKSEFDKQEIKDYVAARFAENSYMFFQRNYYKAASVFAEAALKFKSDPDIRELYETSDNIYKAFEEWDRLDNSSNVIDPVKRYVALTLSEISEGEVEDADYIVDEIMRDLDRYNLEKVSRSIRTIKNSYPGTYQIIKEFCENLQQAITKAKRERNSSRSTRSTSSSRSNKSTRSSRSNYSNNSSYNNNSDSGDGCAGCLFPIIIIFILAMLAG